MQTLVPGTCNTPTHLRRTRGFTLLELLVVVVVVSIAAGLIVIRGTPGDSNYLQAEARKLSQLMRIAQQEALLKSKTIRFVANENGFEFQEFTGSRWVPVVGETMLRPRQWDNGPLDVALINAGNRNEFLLFDGRPGLADQRVILQLRQTGIALESRGAGQFVVGRPELLVNNRGAL